jgi:hypothetical protein
MASEDWLRFCLIHRIYYEGLKPATEPHVAQRHSTGPGNAAISQKIPPIPAVSKVSSSQNA